MRRRCGSASALNAFVVVAARAMRRIYCHIGIYLGLAIPGLRRICTSPNKTGQVHWSRNTRDRGASLVSNPIIGTTSLPVRYLHKHEVNAAASRDAFPVRITSPVQ